MSLRIAICTNFYQPSVGGCEIVTQKIVESLHDHDVYVLTRRMPGRKTASLDHVVEYDPKDVQHFFAKLNKVKPDVVFVYSDVFDFFRHIIKNVTKPRLIVALCGANYLYGHKNYAIQFHRQSGNIESLICHSEYDRDYKFCGGKLKDKTVIIPNAVALDEFDSNTTSREELSHKYGLDSNQHWVINVANFFPGKGQEHMIDVVKQSMPGNFLYLQISNEIESPIGRQLETLWKKKLHTSRVSNAQLLKNIPRKDVIAFFKASNLFALTSEKEVAPLVILEAMAARTPWVSFDVGNVRGLSGGKFVTCRKNRNHQCMVGGREINLFQQNMQELWDIPSLGDLGRRQIEQEMTWDRVLPRYRDLIEK